MMNFRKEEASIFVSIASYRDPQLPLTVASLLNQADYPERVFIGVLNQVHLDKDKDCISIDYPQMQQHVMDYNDAKGVCWARGYIWSELLDQHDFALQIDSHSRFAKGWDTTLLEMYTKINDEKAIITHYPMGFDTETNQLNEQMYTYFNVQKFRDTQLPEVSSGAIALDRAPKQCAKTAFIAAGCLFGRGYAFKEVAYDPYIYFHGEEITYAVRLWTHGYNLYLPNMPFMWHDYQNINQRPLHWQEHSMWQLKDKLAQQRCRHLLRIEKANDLRALHQLEQYGLGFIRSLDEYQIFSGLNFQKQTLSNKVKTGTEY